jgi:DNA polymerase-3 subunit gamma/tau
VVAADLVSGEPAVSTEPAASSTEPVSTEPGAPSSFPSRDQLVQAWGDHILGRLRPKAKALYQAGRFIGVDGERAVFGLPNEIHRTRCEEIKGDIEPVLSEHFGQRIVLSLVVDDGASFPPPPPSSAPSSSPAPSEGLAPSPAGPPAVSSPSGPTEYDETEDMSVFDESQLGDVATVDNSVKARVLQAFPGAEEVS